MSDSAFRSIDFWKSAIMIMPDNSFFELLRSVFGKIKTPFNKQQLINELEVFLLREDIQKNIAGYISPGDAKIIAAVAALSEPVPGELESFFSGELNYAELHDNVVNLEERFIFYRFAENDLSRLALNPVLKPVLAPFIGDSSLLLPSVPAAEAEIMTANDGTVLNDRILAALLSFVSENELFYKAEGEIRKRIIEAGKTVFPGLELGSLTGGLRALGLFLVNEDKLVPDYRHFDNFGILNPRERMEYCAAGIYYYHEAESSAVISPHLLRPHVYSLAVFIHQFLDTLESDRLYPVKTLKRLAGILERRSAKTWVGVLGWKKINGDVLIEALKKAGLLAPASAEYHRPGPLVSDAAASAPDTAAASAPVIAMDSGFSCLVYPEINYTGAIGLASILSIREAGPTVRFELSRESAVRAFDRDISAAMMIDLLKQLSGGRIDDTLAWTLKDWEKRYGEVSLRQGLVLSLSAERRYLAETAPLADLIRETLAPGVYLLAESAEIETTDALRNAGVDIIARRGESGGKAGDAYVIGNHVIGSYAGGSHTAGSQAERNPFTSPGAAIHSPGAAIHSPGAKSPPPKQRPPAAKDAENTGAIAGLNPGAQASTLIEGFRTILEKMQLNRAERDELAARIDRRLVLCETQLRDASVRYEKLEARGLDYVGKVNIAKQAIAQRAPVELVWPGRSAGKGNGPKEERIFGIPKALEKTGGEAVLVIVPPGGEEPARIPLGKISLLRRIKKSIFENSPV
ncbi:hypothetical protein AGMMS50293_28380 [Spirochaetia bacterium]|nr:hypothetical protein AGMMS50293_28380 [Spirochaetia bacterium]